MTQSIKSKVIKTEPIHWKELVFLQDKNFKELPEEAKEKLKQSVISNDFSQPFYVWQSKGGIIYCLDGKHRTLILESLIEDGVQVPDMLPATFIRCRNKTEAAELVLQYSSIYARITQEGLHDFLSAFQLDFEGALSKIDIPEFSLPRFEQKYDIFDINSAEEPPVYVHGNALVQSGDLFEINGHRIVCGSFTDGELVSNLMNGQVARIVNTDPPYNIPKSTFVTKSRSGRLEEFAVGMGEMDNMEFVVFLSEVMEASIANSVEGAIHYIFMDWRHQWHICEAARRVYGSPTPKQTCVWNKDNFANGSFYRSKHELCFVFSNDMAKALWNKDMLDHGGFYKDNDELCFIFKNGEGAKHLSHLELKDRTRSNVWNYPSATSNANPDKIQLENHPTPKPVVMIADSILDTTNPGEIVVDWFLGSGTCLIAAEHTGRRCYATEIEPKYIQGCIVRFLNYCSKKGIEVNFNHLNGKLTREDFEYEQSNRIING